MDVVRSHLGGVKVTLCGIAEYANLVGVTIGYTITASISMVAVNKSNYFHKNGHEDNCSIDSYPYMIIFAVIQIILSEIPNFHKLSWLSILAVVMSFAYASIGLGLSIAQVAGVGNHVKTGLTGVDIVSGSEKVGDIAFVYAYSTVLIEIQDTLRSSTPESMVMKRASLAGVSTTTLFYILCSTIGYAAFGNKAPGNFLTDFGFYEPFWLIDLANVCVSIHLIGAYQVFCQPLYGLVWRTTYVVVTTIIAMIFPFFNDFLGLIGAASFYPLTVYFPIKMHIAQRNIPKYSFTWVWLKILSWTCLIVSLVAAAGSIKGLATDVKHYKPFSTQQ
ncbi:hypothetical protein RND71_026751 [Anisodus tanguticus]|uniref:Amino acid transporter transmembrane domain-containing protein n=1 Tax=Anisodus tanguticus TaxID=243964 RepID=A0AAE1RPG5_9SOLA|nr:hypothetical protein RND71_026751 [Anisodus tanguticus]